jgi:hypothetical protein
MNSITVKIQLNGKRFAITRELGEASTLARGPNSLFASMSALAEDMVWDLCKQAIPRAEDEELRAFCLGGK